MGACGSTNASAARGLPYGADCKEGIAGEVWGSEMDMSQIPNAEKRAMQMPKVVTPGTFGHACRKGRKPSARMPNQDSWCVHRSSRKTAAYGVFDGHGEKGHLISDYVKHPLTKIVCEASRLPEAKMVARVEAAYIQTHRAVVQKPHFASRHAGTTATVVVHDKENERLTVSHVGDSMAVLLKQKAGMDSGLTGVPLTRDHKPELPEERARIEKHGGRVVFDGYCHRVCRKRCGGPGLNMTRSLGDAVAHDVCGATALPEVSVVSLCPEDKALLVCSDGIWEVMTPEEAARIVQDFAPWQCPEAAQRLADEAISRWLQGTDGELTDDVTVVLAWIARDDRKEPSISRASTSEEVPLEDDTASTLSPSTSTGNSRMDLMAE